MNTEYSQEDQEQDGSVCFCNGGNPSAVNQTIPPKPLQAHDVDPELTCVFMTDMKSAGAHPFANCTAFDKMGMRSACVFVRCTLQLLALYVAATNQTSCSSITADMGTISPRAGRGAHRLPTGPRWTRWGCAELAPPVPR